MVSSSGSVGLVGIGAMGGAMARNLARRGRPPWVCDIDPAAIAMAESHGMTAAATPAALAARCEVILVVVVDASQVQDVLFGPDGVAASAPAADGRRRTVVLCPTIGPADTERFAARLAAAGIDAVDAPISGGPQRAEAGGMSMMVAAPDDVVQRCEPLLRDLAASLYRVGARPGDGARAKLVNNLLAGINLVAGAQALALGAHLGLDRRTLFELIQASSGASWIVGDRMPRSLGADLVPRARTTLLTKDLGLAMKMADDAGVAAPMGREALDTFRAAVAAGLGDLDDAVLLDFVARRA